MGREYLKGIVGVFDALWAIASKTISSGSVSLSVSESKQREEQVRIDPDSDADPDSDKHTLLCDFHSRIRLYLGRDCPLGKELQQKSNRQLYRFSESIIRENEREKCNVVDRKKNFTHLCELNFGNRI